MKIAVITTMFPVLSETFILNQITGLIDRGHDVRVFASCHDYNEKRHEDVPKYDLMDKFSLIEAPRSCGKLILKSLYVLFKSFPRHPKILFNAVGYLRKGIEETSDLVCRAQHFLEDDSYDILHCHYGPNGLVAVRLKRLLGLRAKICTVFHGFDMTRHVDRKGTGVYRELFEAGDLFLPVSEKFKSRLVEMGCPASRTEIHRMGIDLKKFRRKRRKENEGHGKIKFLSVGRLVEKKGIEYAIRAVSKLTRTRPDLDFVYEIVGDGPLANELSALIDSLGCGRNVKMLGCRTQDQITETMEEADIFLAPSVIASDGDQEGLPVVLMEALAKGLIVCSTIHSGIPELIENGVNGFLAPERDENALFEIIEKTIDRRKNWETIRNAGYRKIAERFDIEKLNNRLVDHFFRICSTQGLRQSRDIVVERSRN